MCCGFTLLSLQLLRDYSQDAEASQQRLKVGDICLAVCMFIYLFLLTWTSTVVFTGTAWGGSHLGAAQYHTVGLCSSTEAARGGILVPGRLHWRFPLFTRVFEQVHLPHHRATAAPSTQANSEKERSTNASRERSYFKLKFPVN